MPRSKLEWCVVRLGDDLNWWVEELSDEIHWDLDGLGIVDPRQLSHVLDLIEPLREYGFDPDLVESAFYTFRIEKELKNRHIRLVRLGESIFETEEHVFALPDLTDEEKGAYADFLSQITRARVKMLNDLIEFDQNLTVDELEEEIRERQNADYFEGRAVHPFSELTAILEYVPDGYELDVDEDSAGSSSDDEEGLEDIPDFEEDEENIEEDETMRWDDDDDDDDDSEGDEEDEDSDSDDEDEDEEDEEDEDEDEDEAPRRGRRR